MSKQKGIRSKYNGSKGIPKGLGISIKGFKGFIGKCYWLTKPPN